MTGRIIVVRAARCEGCLYSPAAAAAKPVESRRFLKENADHLLPCHCHGEGTVICRGFFDVHHDRLPLPRFTKKKGSRWQHWLKVAPGTANFVKPRCYSASQLTNPSNQPMKEGA